MVDCGLFQGPKTLKELNYGPFPFDPKKVDFVLQTHAHIDHAGLLPKLSSSGFKGPIFASEGTRDLLTFMLPDSGYIQEMEVEHLNHRNRRHGKPEVSPIYTKDDAEECLSLISPVEYEMWKTVGEGVRARFWNAGHILGSASIEVEIVTDNGEQLRLLFSGDIGPDNKLFHPDPEAPSNFDYVISETTYGGRERRDVTLLQRRAKLQAEVSQALEDDGMLLIPIFAVERTQELITDILALQQSGAIRSAPIFLDSPLAIRVTKVFQQHAHDLEDLEADEQLLESPMIHPTVTVTESKQIAKISGGAIILAASGMCEAGRIRHHLKQWLWQQKATVLFVGYQAIGTLGRILTNGAKSVKIHGKEIKVKAKIRTLDTYSGHADGSELADWIEQRRPIEKMLILTHGEASQMDAMRQRLEETGFEPNKIVCPELDDEIELVKDGTPLIVKATSIRLPAEKIGKPDWHNDLTQLMFDMREAFEKAADDKARDNFLRRLRRAMGD